ncbi:MAG TPA: cation-transporting P-type ATPase [Polyangiaceae bacterium]|nr:cation-transporting P-type ATPase [Polyangiaceae bacterium]
MSTPARPPEPCGLSSRAAADRLRRDGRNELPVLKPTPAWRHLLAQLTHFFAILLWIAGALAVAAGMPELGLAIFLVIVINGVFAYLEEHRAERAAQALQQLMPRRAVVERDGSWLEIAASELVVGDWIQLSSGDLISADVQVSQGRGLSVDQSALTGESVPIGVGAGEPAFAGTFVVEGEACARILATGEKTRLARVAQLTQSRLHPPTPLSRELGRLVRAVAVVAVGLALVFFAIGRFLGLPLRDGFLFAVGVAVALVPEGLLPTVTLSLAVGASKMAKRGALVRRLEAIETLGSTTFICSDKTGTLTCNEMNAVETWTASGVAHIRGNGYEPRAALEVDASSKPELLQLALVAVRCSSGRALYSEGRWVSRGDPMEAALHALSLRLGIDLATEERAAPELTRFAFDPRRRLMSVVTSDAVFTKGAPDAVFERCTQVAAAARRAAAHMAERGLRVIAVAQRATSGQALPSSASEAEAALELLGLIGLADPPRREVKAALAVCRQAGLRVAMITGDHPGTARAIAQEVGLAVDLVVTGNELPEDEAELGVLLDREGVVACRVAPEQKLRIAKALQARGHVVAMTGDGVNDGPALRQADIGIAMGRSGTDVARAAADLVLLDDRFETIVSAIEQGRGTFANIRRFLTYHLTDNVAELTPFVVWALSGGRFPLALGVLQILCLDLLTDQLPALALGTEPPSSRLLDRPPYRGHIVDRRLLVRAFLVLGSLESLVEMLAFWLSLRESGWRYGDTPTGSSLAFASGAAFVAVVAGQSAVALVCRSSTLAGFSVPLRSNPRIPLALLTTWAITACLLLVPGLARLLGQRAPTGLGWLAALLAFPLILLVDAAAKAVLRRRLARAAELRRPSASRSAEAADVHGHAVDR